MVILQMLDFFDEKRLPALAAPIDELKMVDQLFNQEKTQAFQCFLGMIHLVLGESLRIDGESHVAEHYAQGIRSVFTDHVELLVAIAAWISLDDMETGLFGGDGESGYFFRRGAKAFGHFAHEGNKERQEFCTIMRPKFEFHGCGNPIGSVSPGQKEIGLGLVFLPSVGRGG